MKKEKGSQQKIVDMIVERITELVTTSGKLPWERPWLSTQPCNLVTYKAHVGKLGQKKTLEQHGYKGINAVLLGSLGFTSPFFLTYNQAKELGGRVKKNSHGFPIVFYKVLSKEKINDAGETETESIPLLRYSIVFNVEQIEHNITLDTNEDTGETTETGTYFTDIPEIELPSRVQGALNPELEALITAEWLPEVKYGGNSAHYTPDLDVIQLPTKEQFVSLEHYYSVWSHEAGHSTGAAKRLNRKGIVKHTFFGSELYGEEELIACLTQSMVCGWFGFWHEDLQKLDAAYTQSWLSKFQDDPRMILRASSAASKAFNWILNGNTKVVEESENETLRTS